MSLSFFLGLCQKLMSDFGRKNFTTQIAEKVTPQQEKSTGEKLKETFTGLGDKVAAAITPQQKKSVPQQVADKARQPST